MCLFPQLCPGLGGELLGRTVHGEILAESKPFSVQAAASGSIPLIKVMPMRGFARFVNVGDERGETPLNLAARRRWTECVRVLLDHGALVSSSTREYGHSGSTPLHLAACGGSLDCVRTLLAWGADQLQRDSSGRIPYSVAIKHNHGACAALLNPSAAEPLVWPSPLKFISELDPDARALLEVALMDANKESEKIILNERKKLLSPANVDEAFHDDASEGLVKQFAQGHNSSIYWLSEPIMISLLQLNSAYLIAKGNLYTRSREDAASKLLEKALKIKLGRGF
ncbi:hypothetical protein ZIOFF_072683 [Zingiber officinale]|uniref:Uncharacterized protein n=1 Tax=Zingiber officinale TaxID=94328 RepID=A0A8J5C675_ZINOF|nr:hypothetical protein ZIOFF_072683 [Zingiber officinale]